MNRESTLFYREAWNSSLVFATPEEAMRVHKVHTAIKTAKTWADFRRLMPEGDYHELVNQVRKDWDEEESAGPMPSDDEAFDSDRLPGYNDGDYPDWLQARADKFLPRDVLERFGVRETTVLNGNFWRLDPKDESGIVAMLATRGIEAVKREDLRFF